MVVRVPWQDVVGGGDAVVVLRVGIKGPNSWKVAIILEELNLPYTLEVVADLSELKKEPFESLNPNGRVPVIIDPNTGVTMFESGAIMQYLVEQYDTSHQITYPTLPASALEKSWLHLQMSGQGPYYGQLAWFHFFHPEPLPSARLRYRNEVKRVISVINRHLEKSGQEYLVGERVCVADLAFVVWEGLMEGLFMGTEEGVEGKGKGWEWEEVRKENGRWREWHDRLKERESVKKVFKLREKVMAENGH